MEKSQELLAEAGVIEYIASGGSAGHTAWFRLAAGCYQEVAPSADGFIRSAALPGFWMDIEAQRTGAYQRVFAGIHQGIATELEEKYQALA